MIGLYAIAALLVAGLSFGAGMTVEHNKNAARELAATKEAQVRYHEMENQYEDAAYELEVARQAAAKRRTTQSQAVEHLVERPVYSGVCLDADGVRLFNESVGQPANSTKSPQ